MQLEPYLFFHGRCEEALNFYVKCFSGEITSINRFEGSPAEQSVAESDKQKIMHANFVAGDLKFMASDGMLGEKPTEGDVVLSLATSDGTEGTRVFNALAEGGTITTPLGDAFWGGSFGAVTDRFGMQWMMTIGT